MEKQISIIIPTYNMEKYLNKCLDSLLIPELDEVEVLVVNDGSKDRSLEIAHEYERKYPNSFRVIDKENGNYGSCINAALPLVTGRYVKILDADDFFDNNKFSEFIISLREQTSDVVITDFIIIDENDVESMRTDSKSEYNIDYNTFYNFDYSNKEKFLKYFQMHKITYAASIFKRFNYFQTEGVSYTDTQWAMIPISFCDSITFLDLPLYRYLRGREGQTMNLQILKNKLNELLKVIFDIIKFYNENPTIKNKWYLTHNISYRHLLCYKIATSGDKDVSSLQLFINQDKQIKELAPDLYNYSGRLVYEPYGQYKILKEFRNSNYSPKFSIPFYRKVIGSINSRFNNILNNF